MKNSAKKYPVRSGIPDLAISGLGSKVLREAAKKFFSYTPTLKLNVIGTYLFSLKITRNEF